MPKFKMINSDVHGNISVSDCQFSMTTYYHFMNSSGGFHDTIANGRLVGCYTVHPAMEFAALDQEGRQTIFQKVRLHLLEKMSEEIAGLEYQLANSADNVNKLLMLTTTPER